ncbi:nitrate reductase cytochrome c-type subunit [Rhodoferax sp.]|uniref:nitrate reductase cytochrome c-type subunit n=1 Tax=Rhodoferax sp. TaxID=50421 RepID=UPI002754671D|nr:nitrate reductase cytochrome c-type subunit [Rhodoferax sp.]
MKKTSTLTLATVLAAMAWALLTPSAHAADPTKSMRGADVSAADAPADTKAYLGKRPGTQPLVARTFSTQPPVIPHAMENFDEVTLTENQCLDCHGPDVYKKKNAPVIGKSHFIDRDGKKLTTSSATRHSCVLCHVQQVDAPPLVENAFKGDVVPAKPVKK